jgi:hypothetical protein
LGRNRRISFNENASQRYPRGEKVAGGRMRGPSSDRILSPESVLSVLRDSLAGERGQRREENHQRMKNACWFQAKTSRRQANADRGEFDQNESSLKGASSKNAAG